MFPAQCPLFGVDSLVLRIQQPIEATKSATNLKLLPLPVAIKSAVT